MRFIIENKKYNSSKIVWIILIPCIIFYIWYLSINYYNLFSLDDYWHGTNVNHYGYWSAQKYYYLNWEGSFYHTFFATLPHIKFLKNYFEQTGYIYTSFSLFSIICVLSIVCKKLHFANNFITSIIISSYLISILYLFTSAKEEILYWTCANLTYITGISLFIISIFLFTRYEGAMKFISLIPIFLVLGNKINYGVLFFLTVSIVFIKSSKSNQKNKIFLIIILISILIFCVNIFAPGNFIRLKQNVTSNENYYTYFEVLKFRLFNIIIPFTCKVLFFLIPLTFFVNSESILKYLPSKILGHLFVTFYFIESLIFWISFKDPGPTRSNILLEFICLIFLISIIHHITKIYFLKSLIFSILISILLVFFHSNNLKFISIARIYNLAYLKRIKVINQSNSLISIESLPNSGLLHSVWCNDEIWLTNVFVPYFNKQFLLKVKR